MLPPDNFQETPNAVVAHRTSPTNLGLYLLSAVSAYDFGWTGLLETIERLEATLGTMNGLERFRGHFFNWYDTQEPRALEPKYISSVDSGNLAGHLIALANAARDMIDRPPVAVVNLVAMQLARTQSITWMVPLANGYSFCMIDVAEQGYVMRGGCSGAPTLSEITELAMEGNSVVAHSTGGDFMLDTSSGELTRVPDLAATLRRFSPPLQLDLGSSEIAAIVWATGFRPDYGWLDVPVVDAKGHLRHDGGVVDSPGLYALGLPVLRRRRSTFIYGIEDDAREVINHLARYLAARG